MATVFVITSFLSIITPFIITYFYIFFCNNIFITLLLRIITYSLLPIIMTSLLHIITSLLSHYYIIIKSLFLQYSK